MRQMSVLKFKYIRIKKNRTLTINQHTCISKVLKKFFMENLKAAFTLINSYKYIKPALNNKLMMN